MDAGITACAKLLTIGDAAEYCKKRHNKKKILPLCIMYNGLVNLSMIYHFLPELIWTTACMNYFAHPVMTQYFRIKHSPHELHDANVKLDGKILIFKFQEALHISTQLKRLCFSVYLSVRSSVMNSSQISRVHSTWSGMNGTETAEGLPQPPSLSWC